MHEDYRDGRSVDGAQGMFAPGGGVASWGGDEDSDPLLDPVGFFHNFGDLLGNIKLFNIFPVYPVK